MTELKEGTGAWAEAMAREGHKVQSAGWPADNYVRWDGKTYRHENGDVARINFFDGLREIPDWSIYEEAAPEPTLADLAKQLAELERRFDAMTARHEAQGRAAFEQQLAHVTSESERLIGDPAPIFTTSRKTPEPAGAVMTDDARNAAIGAFCAEYEKYHNNWPAGSVDLLAINAALDVFETRLRASIRARLDAKEEDLRNRADAALDSVIAASIASCDCGTKSPSPALHAAHCRYLKLCSAIEALMGEPALRAYQEGV